MSSPTQQTQVRTISSSLRGSVLCYVHMSLETLCACVVPVSPVMERVSGNVVEFEMSALMPATHYTVKVYAVRDLAKSAATTTEFTTGELAPG